MLCEEVIAIDLKCQQYVSKCHTRDLEEKQSVILFESTQETQGLQCPYCQGKVYADVHLPGSGDELPMTACDGNLIGGEISRNEQFPLWRVAPIEAGELRSEQAPKNTPL